MDEAGTRDIFNEAVSGGRLLYREDDVNFKRRLNTAIQMSWVFNTALTIIVCAGVIAELWLTEHIEQPLQLLPFAVCALGILTAVAVLLRPSRVTIVSLRIVMLLATATGLIGIYSHLNGNLEFAREINASKADAAPIQAALSGANPPLAPGALVVVSAMALAATYGRPIPQQTPV